MVGGTTGGWAALLSAKPPNQSAESRDQQRTDSGDRRSDRMQYFFLINA
jgi:hypothetical protein